MARPLLSLSVMSVLFERFLEDLPALAALSAAQLALLLVIECVGRWRDLPREWTRKAAHVGSGLLVSPLPWIVEHPSSFALVAVVFALALTGAARLRLLASVNGVRRRSHGVVFFPLAVAALFALSGGRPVLFLVPLAILAISDALAALVGQHLGRWRFRWATAERSLEGSGAFLASAFVVTFAGLSVAGVGTAPERLVMALVVSLIGCALETVSIDGSDNLTIPLGTFAALSWLLSLPPEALLAAATPVVAAAGWGTLAMAVSAGVRIQEARS